MESSGTHGLHSYRQISGPVVVSLAARGALGESDTLGHVEFATRLEGASGNSELTCLSFEGRLALFASRREPRSCEASKSYVSASHCQRMKLKMRLQLIREKVSEEEA